MSDKVPSNKWRPPAEESRGTQLFLIGITFAFLSIFLLMPLAIVFTEALRQGLRAYVRVFLDKDVQDAILLTCFVTLIVVPLNVIFSLAAAWTIAKFDFPGKSLLTTLIDLPFSISPVVSGLVYVLVFGSKGILGPWLSAYNIVIIFAVPGVILVTLFVTFPFIARELIPLMQEQGSASEEAALTLGASGLKTFITVTLPNIKWGLLYGVLLCNARAMGEFGAIAVVSGHIMGSTITMPLQIEIFYNDYNPVAAFATASLLACLALVTLAVKSFLEWRYLR